MQWKTFVHMNLGMQSYETSLKIMNKNANVHDKEKFLVYFWLKFLLRWLIELSA